MANKPRILAFAGSLRKGSWNKKLVRAAAEFARKAGADVTILDMKDYPLPIYDGDDEKANGLPENVLKLKAIFKDHDALMISSPEYNSGYPGGLKNLIDWVSRPMEGEKPLAAFKDKPALLFAASPGARGGARMMPMLRETLLNIGVMVLPAWYGLANADQAFDEQGNLIDSKASARVNELTVRLVEVTSRLAG